MKFYNDLKKYQLPKKEVEKLKWRWCLIKCEKAKNKLANHFLPLALKIATNFASSVPHIDLYEYFNEAYLAIHQALEFYNFKKANMSTFVYKYIYWHLKNFTQKISSPVEYSYSQKKKMKENGISMNPVYLSECNLTFIDTRTPLTKLIKSL